MEPVPIYRFEQLVRDALDGLPTDLVPVLDNVVVRVLDRDPDEPDLLGLYDGVPHTERTGAEGLRRLFDDPAHLPTPNEVDAPGLWLARIDLPT